MSRKKKGYFLLFMVSWICISLCGCKTAEDAAHTQDEKPAETIAAQEAEEATEKEDTSLGNEIEHTYTMDQLSIAMSYNEEHEIAANGKMKINYTEQYGEICFAIPDDIDHNRIEKIVCNVSSEDVKGLSVKMLKSETCYEDSEQIAVAYETNMVERGNDFQSAAHYVGVMGLVAGYTVDVDSITFCLSEAVTTKKSIQQDIPDLKDAVCEKLGDDFIVGAVLSSTTAADERICELVKKHFNAVTLENELKPDALLGNGNNTCQQTETVTINDTSLVVPKLNFARAEMILNQICEWNEKNPEDTIKVRGHVLIWHSQTPEWFFHEEYKQNNPYVSAEEMTLRQEWYIKSVLEHFTGQDSKYKDLFYGWDVVNEAISDATGSYRSDSENSSWWAVYQSNKYITDAFVFANKYAPESLELYYNDYNDCVPTKVNGICKLLTDVKNTPLARISGFGMQGHNSCEQSPSIEEFENAVHAYASIVDHIQYTEFDLKASKSFDDTEEARAEEYTKQAYRYKDFYDSIQKLQAGGISFTGWTVWGTIDRYSWLQSAANVGGASDGTTKQCPLLFDDAYQAKPAYWALVDDSKLEPNSRSVIVNQTIDDSFENGIEYMFSDDEISVSFVPVWDETGMKFMVHVSDKTEEDSDCICLYTACDGEIKTETVKRADALKTQDGYQTSLTASYTKEQLEQDNISFDLVVINDGAQKLAFNDTTLCQEEDARYYVKAQIRPFMLIHQGTIVVDGEMDDAFTDAYEVMLTMRMGAKADASARLLWDDTYLYVYVDVKDAVLNQDNENEYERDSFEIFIDENHNRSASYEEDDKQYRIDYVNHTSFNGTKCLAQNMESVTRQTEDGYVVEAKFQWTDLKPQENQVIGIDLQINDADATKSRIGTLNWYDLTGQGWSSPAVFGEARLVK